MTARQLIINRLYGASEPLPLHALDIQGVSETAASARLRHGVVALAVALALGVALVESGVPAIWRLTLFVPFFFAAAGFYQGLYRT